MIEIGQQQIKQRNQYYCLRPSQKIRKIATHETRKPTRSSPFLVMQRLQFELGININLRSFSCIYAERGFSPNPLFSGAPSLFPSVCVSHVTNMIEGKTYSVTAREPNQNKSTKRESESTTRKPRALLWPLASPMPRHTCSSSINSFDTSWAMLCALVLVGNEWEPAENEHFTTR